MVSKKLEIKNRKEIFSPDTDSPTSVNTCNLDNLEAKNTFDVFTSEVKGDVLKVTTQALNDNCCTTFTLTADEFGVGIINCIINVLNDGDTHFIFIYSHF